MASSVLDLQEEGSQPLLHSFTIHTHLETLASFARGILSLFTSASFPLISAMLRTAELPHTRDISYPAFFPQSHKSLSSSKASPALALPCGPQQLFVHCPHCDSLHVQSRTVHTTPHEISPALERQEMPPLPTSWQQFSNLASWIPETPSRVKLHCDLLVNLFSTSTTGS